MISGIVLSPISLPILCLFSDIIYSVFAYVNRHNLIINDISGGKLGKKRHRYIKAVFKVKFGDSFNACLSCGKGCNKVKQSFANCLFIFFDIYHISQVNFMFRFSISHLVCCFAYVVLLVASVILLAASAAKFQFWWVRIRSIEKSHSV